MEERLMTKYGRREFQVISLENTKILAVKRWRKIRTLEGAVDIPQGTILMPYMGQYHIFPFGVYEALRSRKHALVGYGKTRLTGGEKKELNEIVNGLRETVSDLLQYTDLNEKEKQKINDDLTSLYGKFIKKRNPLKNEAKEYIQKSFGIIDSLGRINPSATSAKLSAAKNRLEARIKDIYGISMRLHFWEIILLNALQGSIRIFEDLFNYTERVLKDCERPNFDDWQKVMSQLEYHAWRLKRIIVNPFVCTAHYCLGDIEEFCRAEDFNDSGKIILQRLNQASLLKIKQRELERIIWWLCSEQAKGLTEIGKFRENIHQKVSAFEKNIAEGVTDKHFKKKIFLPIFWSKFEVLYQALKLSDFQTVQDYLKSISHDL